MMVPDIKRFLNIVSMIKIALFVSIIYFLSSTIINQIDYQDNWTLNNLQIPYVFFVVTYTLLFLLEEKTENLLMLAILGNLVFLLVPNLKYSFFLGRSMDQHIQYLLSREVVEYGKIGVTGPYLLNGRYYTESPLFHTCIATFSIITGSDILNAFKFFPNILLLIYPLYFYSILNHFNLNNKIIKYSLYLSSLPLKGTNITGEMFVFVFFIGIINQYIKLINEPDRINYIILTLLVVGATMAHQMETLNFLFIMLVIVVSINILRRFDKDYLIKQTFVGIIINLGWVWLRESQFDYLGYILQSGASGVSITPTLGLLMQTSLRGTIIIFLSQYGEDLLLSIFMLISIIYLVKNYIKNKDINDEYKFIMIYFIIVTILTLVGAILRIGYNYYARIFRQYYFILVIFSGYFLTQMDDKKAKRILPLMLSSILIMTTFQSYSHPLMTPSASLILPVDEEIPMRYRGEVNSIYQRELVAHVYNHFEGRIASDGVTQNQVMGLTDGLYFNRYITWFYPPEIEIRPNMVEKSYQVFMLHFPGISGSFEERADVRDYDTIIEQIYRDDLVLVYSNSQSFLLFNRFY